MSDRLRFGILSTGNIARQFAEGVAGAQRSTVVAVGSRKADTAQAFADKYGVATAYGDYDSVISDPQVDAVYNALPNHMHLEWAVKALEAGKHVLCEKPFAMNLEQAERMFEAAERHDRLLVEAFMYRSHPLTHAVLDALRSGAIGELRLIKLGFNYCTNHIEGNIRFDPSIGGGGLMDIGCYCIDFAQLMAGERPSAVHAAASIHESGVDDMAVGSLKFPSGVLASFTCGMRAQSDNAALLCGTQGYIKVPVPWKPPVDGAEYMVCRMTPPRMDKTQKAGPGEQRFAVDAGKPLYALEADHFAESVLDGRGPAVSRADTLSNMAVLDEMRGQVGLGG